MRKDKVFSVSMTTEEVDEIDSYLSEYEQETGHQLSRNQFLRKAGLALLRTRKAKKPVGEYFEKEFKHVGCKTKT